MLLLLLLLQIFVIMIRYNTTIPSHSRAYKALISATKSTTKSTMSIYLTSAPLGTFPPSSTKPTLFFSRASPQIISLLASQAPRRRRRRNFRWLSTYEQNCKQPKLIFRMPFNARAYLIKDLLVLSLLHYRRTHRRRISSSCRLLVLTVHLSGV